VRCTMPFMFLIYNNYMPHMRSSGTVYCVCVCSVGRCFFFVFFFFFFFFCRSFSLGSRAGMASQGRPAFSFRYSRFPVLCFIKRVDS